jgi:hypothetical protein
MDHRHVLLGWHRGFVVENDRVRGWIDERETALKEALQRIRGGNDVFRHMKSRGWLDLGPQMKAVKTAPLSIGHLDDMEIVTLRVRKLKGGATIKVAIGLLDRSLCVRAVLLQTPDMQTSQGNRMSDSYTSTLPMVMCPTVFRIGRSFRARLDALTERMEAHISVQAERFCNEKRGWAPFTEQRICGGSIAGAKELLYTTGEDYPRFDAKRQLIRGGRIIFKGTRVRGLLEIPSMLLICTHHGFGYFDVSFQRHIRQLLVLPPKKRKCLFIDDE